MPLSIELLGHEDPQHVQAVMAGLVAYANALHSAPSVREQMHAHMLAQQSGGAQMAMRAQEAADQAATLEKFGPMTAGMPRDLDRLRKTGALCSVCQEPQFSTPSGDSCVNGHGGADAVLPPAPPVPAAPVSAIPPVPPAPSAADAGASATAPAAPPAGAPPLPPAVPLPPASPSAPVAAATPAAAGPVLDASGLPWDGRIHSESRAQVADGTWRRRRGVDQAVVDSVTAELRALHGQSAAPLPPTIPAVPVTAPVAPSLAAPATTAKVPDAPTVTAADSGTAIATGPVPAPMVVPPAPSAQMPVVPPAPIPPTSQPGASNDDFEQWFQIFVRQGLQGGLVTQADVAQGLSWLRDAFAAEGQNVPNPTVLLLKTRPDLRAGFVAAVPGLAAVFGAAG